MQEGSRKAEDENNALRRGADPRTGRVQQPVHRPPQFKRRRRLRQRGRGAGVHRYLVHASSHEAGGRQNFQLGRFGADVAEYFGAIPVGEAHIQNHELEFEVAQCMQRMPRRTHGRDVVAVLREYLFEQGSHDGLIFDDENPRCIAQAVPPPRALKIRNVDALPNAAQQAGRTLCRWLTFYKQFTGSLRLSV